MAAVVGGSVCALLAHQFRGYALRRELGSLVAAAKLCSLLVDPAAHAEAVSDGLSDSASLAEQRLRLQDAFSQAEQIAQIYTVCKNAKGYFVILDARLGGKEEAGYPFMTPIDRETAELVATFKDAEARAAKKPYRDRRGVWYAAYAPVVDASGRVSAVVVVERSRAVVDEAVAAVTGPVGTVALVIASLSGFALILGLRKVDWIPEVVRMRLRAAQSRRFLTGSLLIGTSIVIGVEAISAAPALVQNSKARDRVQRELSGLSYASEALSALSRGEASWMSKADAAVSELRPTSLPWVVPSLNSLRSKAPLATRQAQAQRLSRSLERETRLRQGLLMELQESDNALSARMQRTLVGTGILAFVCLLVLRASTIQDRTIAAAIDHTSRIEREYKRVIDTMPIGLVTFSGGTVSYANSEHEKIFGRFVSGASLDEHFARVLPDDREGVVACLSDCSDEAKPSTLNYRVVRPLGDTGFVQTRIVPIFDVFGSFQQMLGFTIDVTENVQAQGEIRRSHAALKEKNELLESAIDILETNLESFVKAMVRAIEAKDIYTAGHSERVTEYSVAIAEVMGLSAEQRHIIATGAMVHDIGKIGIPGNVLTKPSSLTPEERAIIQRHPVVGATILAGVPAFEPCLSIIRHHHERLDGTGYPDGLKGDDIPIEVRIVSAADAFDAMTSQRSYRKDLALADVFRELEKDVQCQRLDANVVVALKQVIRTKGIIGQRPKEPAAQAA